MRRRKEAAGRERWGAKREEENKHDLVFSSLRKELPSTVECARKEREDHTEKDR